MRLLLDSDCLFLAAFDSRALPQDARAALLDPANEPLVSAISPYELEVKRTTGKLTMPDVADWSAVLRRSGYAELPVSVAHGVLAARLPLHHRDPWDRMIVAQAMIEGCVILSGDRVIPRYGVPVIW